ncbi:MAG: GNAT family N-acetyltransferase [Tannerella sp.]|jgi:lipid II:glycine glycyltransferase (peptidoglycan interpeptide bridge formation enzyme)|nr:GNAT family N-acetyltransferase [Tannerella sp.]
MSKKLYRELCAKEDSIPVFSRDWWLDIVCGGDWDVLVFEKKGGLCAAMPLYIPCRRIVSMPHYTQTMGIWFAGEADDTKYSSILENRRVICRHFIKQLKKYRTFFQSFSYEFTDWLPFYWEGYSQTTRYTYVLKGGLNDTAKLLANMSRQTRRNISRAEKLPVTVRRNVPVDDFLRIQSLTFQRQNKRNTQSSAVLRRLIDAARKRGQGDIFGGYGADGRLHAVAFVVWQRSSAYYMAGGGDPALRSSGAHSLVMWEAIKYVSQYTDRFDFEGSMIFGVERFFREFGAVQAPYFVISRGKPNLADRIRIKLKRIWKQKSE